MVLNIIFGCISLFCMVSLVLYRRQMQAICRQLAFIKQQETNKLISTQINSKDIRKLADYLNDILLESRKLEAEYRKKDCELRETITNISHDIRTPLTSLDGYFQLLSQCEKEEDQDRYIQIIKTRVSSLKDILEQLFTFVKLQNNSYILELDPCNLNQILCEVMFSFYDDIKAKGIEPNISIPEGVDELFYIDANEAGLKRVLQNMIKNALDYGRESFVLELKAIPNSKKSNTILLSLENKRNPEEEIEIDQVFNRFYRADKSRSRCSTGLGLFIARELVKKMGGQISAYVDAETFGIKVEFEQMKLQDKERTSP